MSDPFEPKVHFDISLRWVDAHDGREKLQYRMNYAAAPQWRDVPHWYYRDKASGELLMLERTPGGF